MMYLSRPIVEWQYIVTQVKGEKDALKYRIAGMKRWRTWPESNDPPADVMAYFHGALLSTEDDGQPIPEDTMSELRRMEDKAWKRFSADVKGEVGGDPQEIFGAGFLLGLQAASEL